MRNGKAKAADLVQGNLEALASQLAFAPPVTAPAKAP